MTCELLQKARRARIEFADALQFIVEPVSDLVDDSDRSRLVRDQYPVGQKELLRRCRRRRFAPARHLRRQQIHPAVVEHDLVDGHTFTARRMASTAVAVGVPGRKISRIPISFIRGMSFSGMIPPAKTTMSSALSSLSSRMISG